MTTLWDDERAWELVAAMVSAPAVIPRVFRVLEPADMGEGGPRRVFDALVSLTEQSIRPDVLLVRDELRDPALSLKLQEHVREAAIPSINAEFHARHLRALALLRRVRETGSDLQGVDPTDDPTEVIAKATEALRLAGQDVPAGELDMAELVHEAERDIDSIAAGDVIRTGLPKLDQMLDGGLHPSRLYVLGAKTGVGKSALASNIARLALDADKLVLYASLEMTGREVLTRTVAEKYDIDHRDLGRLIESWNSPAVQSWPLRFMPLATLGTLTATARRLRPEGLRLVILDYVQLLPTTTKFERRDLEIGHITRTLKLLAVELNVAVLALSQINRGADETKAPHLANLRESGNLEQDCNVALLLHRIPDDPIKQSEAVLAVAKNRHGPLGNINLHFSDVRTRFRERSLVGVPA